MASSWALWDRTTLLAIVTILGLSTGLASVAPEGFEAVTGHTGFVSLVRVDSLPEDPGLATISYGLATYRDIRLFGLWSQERPLAPTQDRMVFVWSDDAPDPRDAERLPTGEFARVRDRTGAMWTVYEFTYDVAGQRHYTYGTRLGAVHHADDPTVGDHGAYNYVLVYRPARLLTTDEAPGARITAPAPDAAATAPPAETLPDGRRAPTLEDTLEAAAEMAASEGGGEAAPEVPRLAFGAGTLPPALAANDPAPPLPIPPGV